MISLSKRRQPEVELVWSMTLMATSVKGVTTHSTRTELYTAEPGERPSDILDKVFARLSKELFGPEYTQGPVVVFWWLGDNSPVGSLKW